MRKLLCILTLLLASSQALAQPVSGLDYADSHTAPGQVIYSGTIECNATGTRYLAFDSTYSAISVDDRFLVPDDSRVVARQVYTSASSTTTCALGLFDSPAATIGVQGAAATEHDVADASGAPNGTSGQGALYSLRPADLVAFTVKRNLTYDLPGYRTGLCSAPTLGSRTDAQSYTAATDRVRHQSLDVYGSCKDDAECSGVAGMASGTTCLTSSADINTEIRSSTRGGAFARGLHLGCRCTGAANVKIEVLR